jgi:hypothetical protein
MKVFGRRKDGEVRLLYKSGWRACRSSLAVFYVPTRPYPPREGHHTFPIPRATVILTSARTNDPRPAQHNAVEIHLTAMEAELLENQLAQALATRRIRKDARKPTRLTPAALKKRLI